MRAVMQIPQAGFAPMVLSDLDALLRIERQACRFPWSRGNFVDSMASGYLCQVYRSDEEVLGYFILMMAVDEAHLLNIVVAPAHQGKKLGVRLLHQAMMMAQDAGGRILLLEVRPSNTAALALYRRAGFRQIGVRRNYYRDADGSEDAVVMSRALEENALGPATSADLPNPPQVPEERHEVRT